MSRCLQVLTNLLGMVWLFTAQNEGPANSWLANVGARNLPVRCCSPASPTGVLD